MFESSRSRGGKEKSIPSRQQSRKSIWMRYVDVALVAALALIIVYIAYFTVRIEQGYAQVEPTPQHTLRLQVVNGSGVAGQANDAAARLKKWSDETIEIKIVETVGFDLYTVPVSFVISRDKELIAAEEFARVGGLTTIPVTFSPMPHNTDLITATLVIGEDFNETTLVEPQRSEK